MATIHLNVVTPEKEVFTGETDEVRAPGANGLFGVRPGHAPLLTVMEPGELTFRAGGELHRYVVGFGFIEVAEDRVTVLADTAERASDIDLDRARRAAESARAKLATLTEGQPEYEVEQARLRRALARIAGAKQS